MISSLTLEQLAAVGWIQLERGYWMIASRLHHALDVAELTTEPSFTLMPPKRNALGWTRRRPSFRAPRSQRARLVIPMLKLTLSLPIQRP